MIAEVSSKVSDAVLEKFDWSRIIAQAVALCHTEGGSEVVRAVKPNLSAAQIAQTWEQTAALKDLIIRGYVLPPIALPSLTKIFQAITFGQILDPSALQGIHQLLLATAKWYAFCKNMDEECVPLRRFRASLLTMPKLVRVIDKTIDKEAKIRDDASKELKNVRIQKKNLQTQIEEKLKRMIYRHEFDPYLQDDFITMRNNKYVIPLRVDGNGRVRGNAIDFSRSKETMFFEPLEIEKSNQLLQTIEFSETIACYQILQNISAEIAKEYESLHLNYTELIALDVLNARATLAKELGANAVTLTTEPCINLLHMHHPLLQSENVKPTKNSVCLKTQHALVVSGANAGGKTVLLKAVGLLHLMAKAGLMVTADANSEMFIFHNIHLVLDDEQNITQNLSTFSSHLTRLRETIAHAANTDLVLIDEIATGTEPDTGSALAQAILEHLVQKETKTLVTTHYNMLKELAFSDDRFRNAAMQFSLTTLQPTYRLQLDVPGQSFGLEISRTLGLPEEILARALTLRGDNTQKFETALQRLQDENQKLQEEKNKFNLEILKMQKLQDKWKKDAEEIEKLKKKLARDVEKIPAIPNIEGLSAQELKNKLQPAPPAKLLGKPLTFEKIEIGMTVYCLPLKKTAEIVKIGENANIPIIVNINGFRTKVMLSDLRVVRGSFPPS